MPYFEATFRFSNSPLNDMVSYENINAATEQDAIEIATKKLNEDWSDLASSRYEVECLRELLMYQKAHSITLNIPYDLSPASWQLLVDVYKAMPGWVNGSGRDGCPTWWPDGSAKGFIGASVEPSGLLISGDVSWATWQRWIDEFEQRATAALGFRVHDADD